MIKLKIFLTLFLTSVCLLGCNPNDDDNPTDNPNPNGSISENFGASVTRDFIGQVVDVNNVPVHHATVKIGTNTAQTDENGVFIINEADVYERFAYITATKPGFIDGSRALVPTTGKNNIKIMLLPFEITETIAAGSSATVDLPNGSKVVFDGAFQDANGAAYSGNVDVAMFHLKPSNENLGVIMPGMLYAEDASGQEKVLETYGMMHVELRGSGGQKLQIASGHTAEITLEIDPSQSTIAPATIPLWHFDQEKGYWKEDGVATKQGNKYVGNVSHFSWWNCDAPFLTIELSMTVVDENGNPLPGINVVLVRSAVEWGAGATTDNNGQASGLVPANETLTMNIYSYSICGSQALSTTTIGPFATNTTLPNVVVDSPLVESVMIQGDLIKCNNTPVTNGYVMFTNGYQYNVATVTAGSFNFSTLVCDTTSEFVLKGVDLESLQTTDSLHFAYTAPITNVGNIPVCNAVTEFITYQVDSNPTVFIIENVNGASGFINGFSQTTISGYNNNQTSLYIYGNVTAEGIYTTANFSLEGTLGYVFSGSTNTMSFNVSHIGAVGEFIDITFNGTFDNETGTHTLTGTAHAIRN